MAGDPSITLHGSWRGRGEGGGRETDGHSGAKAGIALPGSAGKGDRHGLEGTVGNARKSLLSLPGGLHLPFWCQF